MDSRPYSRIGVLLAVAMLLTAVAGCSSSLASSASDGATLVAEQCGRCHPVERVNGAKKDQAGWTATVERMRSHGLVVTDQQAAAIVAYLSKRDSGN